MSNRGKNKERLSLRDSIIKAGQLASNGQEEKIVNLLERFEVNYPFENKKQDADFDRLLALGYAHTDKTIEAERLLERSLKSGEQSPDLYFLLAFVKMNLREYDKVIKAGKKYLEQLENNKQSNSNIHFFSLSDNHASQAHNIIGAAYNDSGDTKQAIVSFRASIDHDPGNHLPYLNLAQAYIATGSRNDAEDVLAQGIEQCRQVQELRMLNNSLKECNTVSACMIVKNEEAMLAGCLDSIRNWVDEIIIVDTGSTDRTVEIAKEYRAKVYHQKWEGDFSKHRNFSIDQATSDWVFIIDADERFENNHLKRLQPLLNDQKYTIISINVYNLYKGDKEQSMSFLPSIRFFRRETNLRYYGIVHNILKIPPDAVVYRADIRLDHLGYDLSKEKMAAKFDRTKKLLEDQLAENPDNAFALFNLAQLYCGRREDDVTRYADEIVTLAGKAVNLTSPDEQESRHIHLMCLNQIAWTYFFTKKYDEARKFAHRALKSKPNYLDPLLLLGHIETSCANHDEAARHYEKYVEVQEKYQVGQETDNMIITHVDSRANAVYGMGMIAELNGDKGKADRYYRKTLELSPGFLEANAHLGRLLLVDKKVTEAKKYFLAQVDCGEYSREALRGLGNIAIDDSDFILAEKYFKEILIRNPDDLEIMVRMAQTYLGMENREQAISILSEAEKLEDYEMIMIKEIAQTWFSMGEWVRAEDSYKILLDKEQSSEIFNDLGNCYFKQNEMEMARDWYRRAIETEPVSSVAYRNLGIAAARMGDFTKSIESFQIYSKLNPEDTNLSTIIGDIYRQTGDYQKALSCYEEALQSAPTDPNALFRLSECYLLMGHEDSAMTGYRRILQVSPHYEPARERLAQLTNTVSSV